MSNATEVRLTDEERQRLSLVTDVQHDDCYETTEPGTCLLDKAVEDIIAARLAPIVAVLERDTAERMAHLDEDDCGCAYKDCYECGMWHNCIHTPLTAIRQALA